MYPEMLYAVGKIVTEPKLYYAISFLNEISMLEILVSEVAGNVDEFWIIESEFTHSGKPKPYNFIELLQKSVVLQPHVHKFKYLPLKGLQKNRDMYAVENYQRDAVLHFVSKSTELTDLVVLADIDEIVRSDVLAYVKKCPPRTPVILSMDWYLYNFNWKSNEKWGLNSLMESPLVVPVNILKNTSASILRSILCPKQNQGTADWLLYPSFIENAGWHLSLFGDIEQVFYKVYASSLAPYYPHHLLSDYEKIMILMEHGVPFWELIFLPFEKTQRRTFQYQNYNRSHLPKFVVENRVSKFSYLFRRKEIIFPENKTFWTVIQQASTDVKILNPDIFGKVTTVHSGKPLIYSCNKTQTIDNTTQPSSSGNRNNYTIYKQVGFPQNRCCFDVTATNTQKMHRIVQNTWPNITVEKDGERFIFKLDPDIHRDLWKVEADKHCAYFELSANECRHLELQVLNIQCKQRKKAHFRNHTASFNFKKGEKIESITVSIFDDNIEVVKKHCEAGDTCWVLEKAVNYIKQYLYLQVVEDLMYDLKCNGINISTVEGNIFAFPKKIQFFWETALDPRVQTICEIGFNAGHSTLNWLVANPRIQVVAFDWARHNYTAIAADFISEMFNNRFVLIAGDSTLTVPSFQKMLPDIKCNVLFIDGGHSYQIAKADLTNFKRMANASWNVVIIDDTDHSEVHQAWAEMKNTGQVIEEERRSDVYSYMFCMKLNLLWKQISSTVAHSELQFQNDWDPSVPLQSCGSGVEHEDVNRVGIEFIVGKYLFSEKEA